MLDIAEETVEEQHYLLDIQVVEDKVGIVDLAGVLCLQVQNPHNP